MKLIASLLLITSIASAQMPSLIDPTKFGGGISGCNLQTGQIDANCVLLFLAHAVGWIFGFTGAVCVLMIIYAGYQIALGKATGSDSGAGKERLQWAIIGFGICVLSLAIIDLVISTLTG